MNFSEVLFLNCINDRKLYGYLPYANRIDNPIECVKEFQKDGYVEFSTPEDNLTRMTVPELKNLLTSHGITAKGTKPMLVKTILENIPVSEYYTLVEPKTKVFLTDKAKSVLSKYAYLFWYETNKNVLFRVSEDEVKKLAETTHASEMISAIQTLNRKKRLNEAAHTSQIYRDMYNEIRYNQCVVCGNENSGHYDLCGNCQKSKLTDNQIFHICQLFSYRNKAALQSFDTDMLQSFNEGCPEVAVLDYKNYCYSFGTPGILYYRERKKRADRQIEPTPGCVYYLLQMYG